ncbi:hypothetical protein V5799_010106 [Amblyomma americanum]|uniref:Uncharacterized protein n=1 Tax=Amblyomma americanum TaxID=6943 RepID=A0AAQ4F907_AMBAM
MSVKRKFNNYTGNTVNNTKSTRSRHAGSKVTRPKSNGYQQFASARKNGCLQVHHMRHMQPGSLVSLSLLFKELLAEFYYSGAMRY